MMLLFGNDQVEGPSAGILANRSGRLGGLRARRHLSHAVKPDGYSYNALQQLSYFTVVFVMASLMAVTGLPCRRQLTTGFPGIRRCSAAASRRGPSLPAYAGLRRVPSHARNDGGCYRVCPEHEQYRYGDRRRQLDRVVPRPGWHWFGRGYLLSRQLDVLETSPRLAVPRKVYS